MESLEKRRADRLARQAGTDTGAFGTRDDLQRQAEKTVDLKNEAAGEKKPPVLASREPGAPTRARTPAAKTVAKKADGKDAVTTAKPNPFDEKK